MADRPKLPAKPPFVSGPFRALGGMSCMIVGQGPFDGPEHVADVRGWGFLTGQGQALALPENIAVKAQIETRDWIIAAMNEKWAREKPTRSPEVLALVEALRQSLDAMKGARQVMQAKGAIADVIAAEQIARAALAAWEAKHD